MDKSLLERVYNNLPKSFRNADVGQRQQLKRYLDIIVSGGFSPLREETKGILNLIDFDKISAEYLPHLASDLGFRFPYDLDEQTQRIYIKNAVTSYRMKGTKKALLFMLRELTKFKVTVSVNEDDKVLTVTMEVDLDRQDIEFLQGKTRFIIDEYAPPYGHLSLINIFMWEELFSNRDMSETENLAKVRSFDSHDSQSALYFNNKSFATLNSLNYNLSSFQQYNRNAISYDYKDVLVPVDEEVQLDIRDTDLLTPPVRVKTQNTILFARSQISYVNYSKMLDNRAHSSDYLFITSINTSTSNSQFNQVSGLVERWNKEKYAIIGKENQSEFTNEETYISMEEQDEFTDKIIYPERD